MSILGKLTTYLFDHDWLFQLVGLTNCFIFTPRSIITKMMNYITTLASHDLTFSVTYHNLKRLPLRMKFRVGHSSESQ